MLFAVIGMILACTHSVLSAEEDFLLRPSTNFVLKYKSTPSWVNFIVFTQAGVTMAQTVLHPDLLDSCVRDVLNQTARRYICQLLCADIGGGL